MIEAKVEIVTSPIQELPMFSEEEISRLPVITERLVPDDFTIQITAEDVAKLYGEGECYPNYPRPDQLVKWDETKIKAWKEAEFPDDWLPTMEDLSLEHHPNYLLGLKFKRENPSKFGWIQEDDGKQDFNDVPFKKSFEGPYHRTKRGIPIHPAFRLLLLHGVPTAREWPGFYWTKGVAGAGDPVAKSRHTVEDTPDRLICKLRWIGIASKALVDNGNTRVIGLPGGLIEPGDPAVTATIRREILEEAGVDEKYFDNPEIIWQGAILEGRTGLLSWPESVAAEVTLPEEEARKITPKGGDDASHAQWYDFSEEVFEEMFSPTHVNILKLAVRKWQEKNSGLVVAKDGTIGRTR